MITARISLEKGWGDKMARRVDQQARVELQRSIELGAEAASQAAGARRRTGKMAEMEVSPVAPTPRGYSAAFRSRAFYAHFQNKGTKSGISPLRFLDKGRTVARADFVARMNRIA